MNSEHLDEKEVTKKRKSELSKLKRLLKRGVVSFVYKKKNGHTRIARGTLKVSLIPKDDRADDRLNKSTNDDVFNYYDLGREDWRAFLKKNFVEIKGEE